MFLTSVSQVKSLTYFLKNATIYSSRNKEFIRIYDIINLTTSIYNVHNKIFKTFLEGPLSKDKPTPLFAIKT